MLSKEESEQLINIFCEFIKKSQNNWLTYSVNLLSHSWEYNVLAISHYGHNVPVLGYVIEISREH